jgi:hypothetical protein
MNGRLESWGEIAAYLHKSIRTAQRYARTRGLPVYQLPGSGPRGPVYAYKAEIDAWRGGGKALVSQGGGDIAQLIVDRISELARAKALYRKNFVLRFAVRPRGLGVEAHAEVEYEIVNASSERQAYTQELTIDDCERGHLEFMSVSADGKPITLMKRPPISEQRKGHVAYIAPTLMIDPSFSGKKYVGKQEWYSNRRDNDYWYLHFGTATLGITVETNAPPEYEITPSFSDPFALLTSGQHLDITWNRRNRRK